MSILVYCGDCSMLLTTEVRELLFGSCSPLGPVHTLDIVIGLFTEKLSSDAEQVRLIAVPSYSGVVDGVMVRVSWGGGTNRRECELLNL